MSALTLLVALPSWLRSLSPHRAARCRAVPRGCSSVSAGTQPYGAGRRRFPLRPGPAPGRPSAPGRRRRSPPPARRWPQSGGGVPMAAGASLPRETGSVRAVPAAPAAPPSSILRVKMLCPMCSSVSRLKLQHLLLSAVPSSPVPTPQPLSASPEPTAAARQLDELLADLGQMQSKVSCIQGQAAQSRVEPVPHSPPSPQLAAVGQGAGAPVGPEHSLDHMLGGLTRDLQELGITAAPAAVCAACHKPIAGKMFTALGETWHPEHFTCARCGQELGGQPFFERGGQAYCEEDYHQAFSPRCAYCAGPIREVSTALPTSLSLYPVSHLTAFSAGFHERGGKPYCFQDFVVLFAPKCQGCERPLTDNYLSALQGVWHPECFVCADCMSSFTNGSFFELEGRPYCELHFHQRQGSVCHGCGRPITGRCITAAGRKYHPEHFICSYCLGQLHKGTFRERGDKMYCQPCHDKLFL
uniref:Leupaxin n=1 Tax=Coturnix japonica TaxID=93934 RepID=A0A8C2U758_COTJA